MGADLSDNLKRAKISLSKLLGRSSGLEELCFYKHMRSCLECHSDMSQLRPGTKIERFLCALSVPGGLGQG